MYIDTSCLLKLVFPEPESARVSALVAAEVRVVVSALARLEAMVQINARRAGGAISRADASRCRRDLDAMLALAPYDLVDVPAGFITTADRQIQPAGAVHCGTLDRLHLAAMHELGLTRILTNDSVQAHAAQALGFTVLMP